MTPTEFRLAMRENGYTPVLTRGKKHVLPSWNKLLPDEAEIMLWSRRQCPSTGMLLSGDLAVVDLDIYTEDLADAVTKAFGHEFPIALKQGLLRSSSGFKRAWFLRTERPFARYASRRWFLGDDPLTSEKFQVEAFGSLTA